MLDLTLIGKRYVKITLVMDNLGTHKSGALYDTYKPGKAKQLWDRFDFVYTPKHGSWLNSGSKLYLTG